MMENGLQYDPEELERLLATGDVITVGFTLFPHRLLIDTRTNDADGQMVRMVEPVTSVQERYLWLGQHRSSFGAPEAFAFFVWPLSIRSLIERDALARLKLRLEPAAHDALEAAMDDALRLERAATVAMIRGDEAWPAIWTRPAA